jgi:hypothetical protein
MKTDEKLEIINKLKNSCNNTEIKSKILNMFFSSLNIDVSRNFYFKIHYKTYIILKLFFLKKKYYKTYYLVLKENNTTVSNVKITYEERVSLGFIIQRIAQIDYMNLNKYTSLSVL